MIRKYKVFHNKLFTILYAYTLLKIFDSYYLVWPHLLNFWTDILHLWVLLLIRSAKSFRNKHLTLAKEREPPGEETRTLLSKYVHKVEHAPQRYWNSNVFVSQLSKTLLTQSSHIPNKINLRSSSSMPYSNKIQRYTCDFRLGCHVWCFL